MIKKIMFVCTGNTCRSAMAGYLSAAIAQKEYGHRGYIFDSAGVAAASDIPATAEAISVLADRCIDLKNHRSKIFSDDMLEKSDLIVAMTKGHKLALLDRYPDGESKIVTLGELSGSGCDVADPYCGSHERYQETAALLDEELHKMFENLEKRAD